MPSSTRTQLIWPAICFMPQGTKPKIAVGDFLRSEPEAAYDAVIGNPPYVRYQAFAGESRAAAQRAPRSGGRNTYKSCVSSWAAFTVHSALHVREGTTRACPPSRDPDGQLRGACACEFLMKAFGRVRLVLFTERVFPGVMEDVVLLLAEGRGEAD